MRATPDSSRVAATWKTGRKASRGSKETPFRTKFLIARHLTVTSLCGGNFGVIMPTLMGQTGDCEQ
jgi:hypothetical protein